MDAAAATPAPLTIESLRGHVAELTSGLFTASVATHRSGFAIEITGDNEAAAHDLDWLNRVLKLIGKRHGFKTAKHGAYVLVKAVR